GPALINFGVRFTGYHQNRLLRRMTLGALLAALALGSVQAIEPGAHQGLYEWAEVGSGALLFASVLLCVGLGVAVARSHSPVALRRRGRLLTKTTLVAFFVPSLTLFTDELPCEWALVLALLTTFPIAMAYAM